MATALLGISGRYVNVIFLSMANLLIYLCSPHSEVRRNSDQLEDCIFRTTCPLPDRRGVPHPFLWAGEGRAPRHTAPRRERSGRRSPRRPAGEGRRLWGWHIRHWRRWQLWRGRGNSMQRTSKTKYWLCVCVASASFNTFHAQTHAHTHKINMTCDTSAKTWVQ